MKWDTDSGLTVRMGVALALVLTLPVAFIYAFVFAINAVGLDLLSWATGKPYNGEVYVRPWLAVGVVLVGLAVQYRYGDSVALRSVSARRVDADERPDLHRRVQRLAQIAEVEPPRVAVSRSDVPNAFTVGVRPSTATVVVTEGALEALDDAELDAVLAHELAHVKNRDVSVMSLAYFLPSLTYLVAIGAFYVLKGVFHVLGSFRHTDGDGAKGLFVAIVVLVVSAIVTMAISALFWLASFTLFRTLSQYREYAADRGAAAITGDPAALASALRTVDEEMSDVADRDLREVDGGLEALYVAPIDDYQFGEDRELISNDIFPATHPSTGERIDHLQSISRDSL
ncbi:M48 family metalloprotease [Halapricum hydrolyticum]|uniref:M48 family metalloprotease n=1 Tax=Halapricum hydrolyticum TaxID=2979991 RepID=A0AAE3ID72_9EURY|nr:M48 family metalloprotease [Halapricum hydrolyticum]MCU4719329.1 M48 family metalloprotease [Halapricum hydrolyticum]MCU4728226.1 M48 family metalloprotease [Halapricum hydrolyticum]